MLGIQTCGAALVVAVSVPSVLEQARDRGLLTDTADLGVVPVFVRAFTFGRVTNELSAEPLDVEAWNTLVEQVMARLLGAADLV